MKILDRYIIRVFLINFVILSIVFMLLFMLVDFIGSSDEFIEAARVRGLQTADEALTNDEAIVLVRRGERPGLEHFIPGIFYVVADYFGPLLLLVFVSLSGLLVTGAMGFTFVAMVRNREILATVASGVSMYRIAAPILVAGCILNMVVLPMQEFVIPKFADKLLRSHNDIVRDQPESQPILFTRDRNGNLLFAAAFDSTRGQLIDMTVLVRSEQGRNVRIRAETADWDEARGGWLLSGGHKLIPTAPSGDTDATTDAQPVDFYETDLSPVKLLSQQAGIYARLLRSRDLIRLQDDPSMGRLATQILHSRFSLMVVNVLVLVMGMPFFMLRLPENIFMKIVIAIGVCCTAWAAGLVMLQIDVAALPPIAAAWLPVVIYLPISAMILQTVRT